jgi:hypothetical protein
MVIPEGLRDVIGRRLSLLSPDCNRLLSVASVIGREFTLDILRTVAEDREFVNVSSAFFRAPRAFRVQFNIQPRIFLLTAAFPAYN